MHAHAERFAVGDEGGGGAAGRRGEDGPVVAADPVALNSDLGAAGSRAGVLDPGNLQVVSGAGQVCREVNNDNKYLDN